MIFKSYEVHKKNNLSKYNFYLLYGENFGLKKDIKDIIKLEIKEKNDSLEIMSIYESEILDNEENFINLIQKKGKIVNISKIQDSKRKIIEFSRNI